MDLERLYREESGRIRATLIRLLGDFDLAEEVMQEAFTLAVERWPRRGVPEHVTAWLIGAARHKAIDRLRRDQRAARRAAEWLRCVDPGHTDPLALDPLDEPTAPLPDDRLRLMFTCCHPTLSRDAQVALTLRTLGGLSTEECARAFLVPVPTMAQRLVRAQRKIRAAGIPFRIPADALLADRLEPILHTLYLIFNEGYAATSGDALVRRDLCAEAIRLARLVAAQLTNFPEALGLLALMLLHDARRAARSDGLGDIVLLEDQDRSRWDRAQIEEGLRLVEQALRAAATPGAYTLQAAIAGCHAHAKRAEDTDWREIAVLYALLEQQLPTPIVRLNHAVAIAMCDGPAVGLGLLDRLSDERLLDGYHLLPAARADLLRRIGHRDEARCAYRTALALVRNEPERRYLERRLKELED